MLARWRSWALPRRLRAAVVPMRLRSACVAALLGVVALLGSAGLVLLRGDAWRGQTVVPLSQTAKGSGSLVTAPLCDTDISGDGAIPEHGGQGEASIAFFVQGTRGDVRRIQRLVRRLWHADNLYIVNLDGKASSKERTLLQSWVESPRRHSNILLLDPPVRVTYRGFSMVLATLRAMAVALEHPRWTHFINVSATCYPMLSPDVMRRALATAPEGASFVHNQNLERPDVDGSRWFRRDRFQKVWIDNGIAGTGNASLADPLHVADRSLPAEWQLLKGEAWICAHRNLVTYAIAGSDGLSRHMQAWMVNTVSSPESFFQMLACNSPRMNSTVAGRTLWHVPWPRDGSASQHAPIVQAQDVVHAASKGHFFVRKVRDPSVADLIDRTVLRLPGAAAGAAQPRGSAAYHEERLQRATDFLARAAETGCDLL
ncbi:unnamed protein product [Pedinophyceae sp. YPF-701]|nr:unnamed protein product [Pedinophyceae sp. YPF-701]